MIMTGKKRISIVIPAYREEKNIPVVYGEVETIMEKLGDYDFEVIFVNDGSLDGTWREILRLGERDARVR